MPDGRDYDIVLFGATGFTGGLTAEYLARNAPDGCRWALAGRNRTKLEAVRDKLAVIDPRLADLPLLTADATVPATLKAVAESTRVVITTVGPYLEHGEPLVAACASAGTDYVDLTGEPEFVDRMYLQYHQQAVESGARLVHCCGFDSIPYDLGALFTVQQLPAGEPISLTGVVRVGGGFSGGTYHSAINQFSRARQLQQTAAERKRVEPRPEGRRVKGVSGKPHKDKKSGYWLVPLPTIDPIVVVRSAAARADYGPKFTYSHFAGVKKLTTVAGAGIGLPTLMLVAQVPPLRRLVLKRFPQGEGPSPEKRARSWFTVAFTGTAGGKTVHTLVKGGDPGYDETSKMLSEAALSLAFDDNPATSGQVTTATAMGENLLSRLTKAGIEFSVTGTE